MLLAIVFDISERWEDFSRTSPPFSAIVFDYYQNFFYFFSNQFSALIIFIAVIYFTSKLAQNTEIVAFLSSGISFNRFLRPYFIAATVLTLISLYSNHFVLPHANRKLIEFEAMYVWSSPSFSNVHRELEKGTFAHVNSYHNGKIEYLWVEKWNKEQLSSVLYASVAYCDSVKNNWHLENYYQRIFTPGKEIIKTGAALDTTFNFHINDFGLRSEYAFTMPSPQLYAYIQDEIQKGNEDIIHYQIELYQRTSFPLATYILTLIAVSVSSRKKRGGLGVNIALGLVVAAMFVFTMKIGAVAATNSGLSPVIAVWIPNMVFSVVALFFYQRARK